MQCFHLILSRGWLRLLITIAVFARIAWSPLAPLDGRGRRFHVFPWSLFSPVDRSRRFCSLCEAAARLLHMMCLSCVSRGRNFHLILSRGFDFLDLFSRFIGVSNSD